MQGGFSLPVTGVSGDPLLKRLVDLAHLGWSARLLLLSNGQLLTGTLISPATFRAALAASIRGSSGHSASPFDDHVASVVDAEDPPVPDPAGEIPEPRFIHLADVVFLPPTDLQLPFLRMRLPAVSAFWVEGIDGPGE